MYSAPAPAAHPTWVSEPEPTEQKKLFAQVDVPLGVMLADPFTWPIAAPPVAYKRARGVTSIPTRARTVASQSVVVVVAVVNVGKNRIPDVVIVLVALRFIPMTSDRKSTRLNSSHIP